MSVIYYASDSRLVPKAQEVLKKARALSYGETEVDFVDVGEAGVGSLNFGYFPDLPEDAVRTMSFSEVAHVPNAEYIVAAAMARYKGTLEFKAPVLDATFFDLETHSVTDRWNMSPRDFVRTMQYARGQDGVRITTDYDEMIEIIESSSMAIGHQIHGFDLSALYGKDSTRPLELARDGRIFDTKTFATYLFPAPQSYRRRDGHWQASASSPANAKRGWLSLDNLSYQFGVPGKEGDLKALAKEFGGFGFIPVDDPRFRAYALQDVVSLRDLTSAMLQFAEYDGYDAREQTWAAIEAQISRNGFSVDRKAAQARVEELADRKGELLATLESEYGFPTEGKMPWRSTKGKEAILALLRDAGVDPETDPDWERTATGNVSLGGKALIAGTEGTPAEETVRLLAELLGHRSIAEMTLEFLQDDDKVRPEIQSLQRSGRSSVTDPGLTVVGGEEKKYFIPSKGRKLVSVDYSAADARAVVAMSGDTEYAKRFEPGVDAHELTGRSVFGDELYDSDPVLYRNASKPVGHGTNYNIGAAKLANAIRKSSGMETTTAQAKEILDAFNATYHVVADWKAKVAREGSEGWVTSLLGRRMHVEAGRAHTQSSGLLGQNLTREVLVGAMIRLLEHDIQLITYACAPVHDEVVFDIPEDRLEETLEDIARLMPGEINGVAFPVQVGKPADSWYEAGHA